MTIERLLQINVAVLAVLATSLLEMGQENSPVPLPLVTLFAATISLVFTDTFGWFRLNRGVANLFALVAAFLSLREFIFDNREIIDKREEHLRSIAYLLVYLQFILLFQHKTPRVYWQLMVLGLLQVVVAAALSLDALSALLLVAYMVAGVSALTLFFLHRESLRVTGQLSRATLTVGLGRAKVQNPAVSNALLTKPLAVFDAKPDDLAKTVLGGRLVRQIAAISALSLLFAGVLFYTVPRRGDSIWRGLGPRGGSRVGFSGREISYGDEGLIHKTNRPVMRVAFRDQETGRPYTVMGQLYLRGTVLTHYSARYKKWRQRVRQRGPTRTIALLQPPDSADIIRQEVVMEPSDGKFLFSVFPWWQDKKNTSPVAFDNLNQKLAIPQREHNFDGGSFRFTTLTDAFRTGWQIRATPFLHDPHRRTGSTMSKTLHSYLTDMDTDTRPLRRENLLDLMRFSRLRRETRRIIESAPDVDPDDHLQVAKALEAHFRTSGMYTYSLDFRNIKRDPSLDPLEDFVVNHRRGHCQYFAGALALMLRSRNIPARVVLGYATTEYNPMGAFFQVRENDAHAWVEAYIEPSFIDKETVLLKGAERTGVWYRLDPTPAAQGEEKESDSGFSVTRKIDQFLDYFRFVWADYVIGLDERRQEQAVYGSLPDDQSGAFGSGRLRSWMDRMALKLGIADNDDEGMLRVRWPIIAGILAGLVLLAFVVQRFVKSHDKAKPKGHLGRWVSRVAHSILPHAGRPASARGQRDGRTDVPNELYARLAQLVAPLGLVRQDGQTQHEFAETIRSRLVQLNQADSVAALPESIVAVFYRIRFGGAALDTQEQENVEQALSKLEEALK